MTLMISSRLQSGLRPIETVHNGYRFRSRLEARWAIFFEQMGIQYEYEIQGFFLADGRPYLPDFYIPRWSHFVEIKHRDFEPDPDVLKVQPEDLLFIIGNPYYEEYVVLSKWNGWHRYFYFAECRRCDGLSFYCVEKEQDTKTTWNEGHETGWGELGVHHCNDHDSWPLAWSDRLEKAYTTARQARFEHGEFA